MAWRLTEAKNRSSEVFNRALSQGPQWVTRRDDAAIIMSERDYEKLSAKHPDFKEFLLGKRPAFDDLDLTRDRSAIRDAKR